MVNFKIGIRFGNFAFVVLVLVSYRNFMTLFRFYLGSIPPRFIVSCCKLLLLLLFAELVRYYLCFFLRCTSTRLPASCVHLLLPYCAFFRNLCPLFGKNFWNLIFGSNFEKQLWGIIVGNNFEALQQH